MIGDRIGAVIWLYPAEDPVGFIGTHVDTAVAHLLAKVLVPVGTMKGVADRSEKRRPGNARQHISAFIGGHIAAFSNAKVAVPHVRGWDFV